MYDDANNYKTTLSGYQFIITNKRSTKHTLSNRFRCNTNSFQGVSRNVVWEMPINSIFIVHFDCLGHGIVVRGSTFIILKVGLWVQWTGCSLKSFSSGRVRKQ